MSQWKNFYESRVNTSYQKYFEKKYGVLLEMLSKSNNIREEGIGIGSISKFLIKKGINTSGVDISKDMLRLSKINNPELSLQQGDILTFTSNPVDLVVTHGVLEHFLDKDINLIIDKYKANNQPSVHYIPLIGHKNPSFGDERLLHSQEWIEKFNPTDYHVFNDKKDMIIIFK